MNLSIFTARLSFLSVILCSVLVYSQELPNYPERTFQDKLDSLKLSKEYFTTGASEGSINPSEYFVGPGDKMFLSISGVRELVYNLSINQEGWIYIPQVGGIDLNNCTLQNSKIKLRDSIDRYYKDVKIFIALTDFRKIKVALIGDVKNPSSYVLFANARLMDLVSNSGGLQESANFRNIKITSKDGTVRKYDLLAFLRLGEYEQNPYLREGDLVLVDRVDKTIRISGQVKYPGRYEFIENETVKRFVDIAGGLLSRAYKDTIEIVSFLEDGSIQQSSYYRYQSILSSDLIIRNNDHIIIREIPEYYIERFVLVRGYVKFPGYYKIVKNKTKLTEVIEMAGGFLEEASLTEATLTRKIDKEMDDPEFNRLKLMLPADMTEDEYDYFKARSRERSGRVVVDFKQLFENNNIEEDIILKKSDIINVPEKKNYITMIGQLVKPGNIIYNSSFSVDEYIALSGGFGWHAEEGEVRVIRANSGEWVYADEVEQLFPGDAIWVPEEPPGASFWEVFNSTLQVLGQVAAVIAAAAAIIIATR